MSILAHIIFVVAVVSCAGLLVMALMLALGKFHDNDPEVGR